MLAPLTKITLNKVKSKWTKIKQDNFDEIKRIVARDAILTCGGFMENLKYTRVLEIPIRNSFHTER